MRWSESKAMQGIAVLLLVFTVILLAFIIPGNIKDVRTFGTSPRFVPQVVAAIIGGLSVWLFIEGRGLKNMPEQKEFGFDLVEVRLVLITFGVLVLNLLLVNIIGYIITTVLSLGFLMWLFGYKNFKVLIVTSIALPVGISYFLKVLLRLYLP